MCGADCGRVLPRGSDGAKLLSARRRSRRGQRFVFDQLPGLFLARIPSQRFSERRLAGASAPRRSFQETQGLRRARFARQATRRRWEVPRTTTRSSSRAPPPSEEPRSLRIRRWWIRTGRGPPTTHRGSGEARGGITTPRPPRGAEQRFRVHPAPRVQLHSGSRRHLRRLTSHPEVRTPNRR